MSGENVNKNFNVNDIIRSYLIIKANITTCNQQIYWWFISCQQWWITMVCGEELNIFGGGGSNIMCVCVHEMSQAHVSCSYATCSHVYTHYLGTSRDCQSFNLVISEKYKLEIKNMPLVRHKLNNLWCVI